jgi:hypothetical protein
MWRFLMDACSIESWFGRAGGGGIGGMRLEIQKKFWGSDMSIDLVGYPSIYGNTVRQG